MYLFEISDNPKLAKMIAAIDQLKTGLDTGEISTNWSIDALLTYFRKFDLILSPEDLYDMIKQKPLKNVISNIQGDEVIFRGIPDANQDIEAPPPESGKKTVNKMAKHAMKKKKK